MFDKVINPSGPSVFFVERSLISNEISSMEMGQIKAIFEPVFINCILRNLAMSSELALFTGKHFS